MSQDTTEKDDFQDAEEAFETPLDPVTSQEFKKKTKKAKAKGKKKKKSAGSGDGEMKEEDSTREDEDVDDVLSGADADAIVVEDVDNDLNDAVGSLELAPGSIPSKSADSIDPLSPSFEPVDPAPTATAMSDVPLDESTQPLEDSTDELTKENSPADQLKDLAAVQENADLDAVEEELEFVPVTAVETPFAIPTDAVELAGSPEPAELVGTLDVTAVSPTLVADTPIVPDLPVREVNPLPVLPPRGNGTLPPLPPREEGSSSTDADSRPKGPMRSEGSEEVKPVLPKRPLVPPKDPLFVAAAALTPPPPPPGSDKRQRPTIASWFTRSADSSSQKSEVGYEENYDLLLSRLSANHEELSGKDQFSREQINSTHDELKSSFADKVSQFDSTADDSELKIDWQFWTQVVNDYPSVVKSDPINLANKLSDGIPEQIRGIVWQLVANSNPSEFKELYELSLTQETQYEKNIQKDLARTSFITSLAMDNGSLYNVIKAYSNLDTEVGYTQGMAFITVPLLINMPELEAFSLLHKIMYGYNARSLYLPEMSGLLLKLYQFDRLVEDLLPALYTHFQRQGIRSSMYATQWFLTFFAYKFPLEFVLRIFDLIITEGIESILKFAIALVQKNEATLLTLKFDDLIGFLKDGLFDVYRYTPFEEEADKSAPITVDLYDVGSFVDEATNVKILPITLKRYETEWDEIHREEKERREEVDQLKLRNTQLRKEIHTVEASYTILNREHVQIANEMIQGRIKLAELEDAKRDLEEQNKNLKAMVKSLQENPMGENVPVPAAFEADLKRTMERNLEVMSQNQELEDQVQSLLGEVDELKEKLRLQEEKPHEGGQHVPHLPHSPGKNAWTRKLFK